jgi:DNA-binding protein
LQSETGASTSRVVTITATGRAVPKAVAVAEIAKRVHGGALHQVTTIDSIVSSHAADGARRRESHESRVTSHTEKGTAAPSANGATTPNRRRVTVIGVALSRDRGALGAGKENAPGYQVSPESPADGGEMKTSQRRRREARDEARSNASAGRRVEDETEGSTGGRKEDAPRRRRKSRRGRGGGANRKKADELLEAEA